MANITPSRAFHRAMSERVSHRPFDRISAYKVRESRGNIESMIDTVNEIIAVVSSGEVHATSILLGSCTTSDKAAWLKDLPGNIAYELGSNLVPAVKALPVEGIPDTVIDHFILTNTGKVRQLLEDCDAMQKATGSSIMREYARMKAGHSEMLRICRNALSVANQAAVLCETYGV